MTIQSEDVRRLLEADGDAVLVLIEGRPEVVSGDRTDNDAHRGALEVISRVDLLERIGGSEISDRHLTEQAALLDAEVAELGG